MAARDIDTAKAEALEMLHRVLALMDRHGFGATSAPYVDLGAHLLAGEIGQAGDQAIDVR